MVDSDPILTPGLAFPESNIDASQSPIGTQPTEILMNIFVFVRILEHKPPTLDPILSSFAVNRRWRSLALSMPILWSTVTVMMPTSYWNNRALLIELYSKRAEPTPQTWIIRDTGMVDEETASACTTLLLKHLPHIQNLVVESACLSRSTIIHEPSTQLSSLKRLTINTIPGAFVTGLLKAPNVEHLYHKSIFHGGTQLFPRLRTLFAMMYARSFYEIILQKPNLEGLTLHIVEDFVTVGSDLGIPLPELIGRLPPSLPFLTTLSLYWSGCNVAIELLPNLPALRQVALCHYPNWRMKDRELEGIGRFLRKLPPTLHILCYSSNSSSPSEDYKRTCKMFFESTQALTHVRKLVFDGGTTYVGATFLLFLQMFFAASAYASVKKLVLPNSGGCMLEALEAFFRSDIVKTWLALRGPNEGILDVDIYPKETDNDTFSILHLASKWAMIRRGNFPFRLNFLFDLSRRTMNTFPYHHELDPHTDTQIPLYS